jgi:tellurite resistance protein TehA-like permease
MATGIVARALAEARAVTSADVLLVAGALLHAVLLAGLAVKTVRHPESWVAELRDPVRLFGHFTLVAASGVLAARLAAGPLRVVAYGLLLLAAATWVVFTAYALSGFRSALRTALPHADGLWFLPVVGLQSISLALTALGSGSVWTAVALVLWACGVLLYVATLAVVVRRLRLDPPDPQGLTPAYWITMGAAAISMFGGIQLTARREALPGFAGPLLTSAVTVLWCWCTLLIPLLIAAGIRRHLHHRVPVHPELALWCIVFPFGMYTTATARLAETTARDTLLPTTVSPLVWAAATAWASVAFYRVLARLRPVGPLP